MTKAKTLWKNKYWIIEESSFIHVRRIRKKVNNYVGEPFPLKIWSKYKNDPMALVCKAIQTQREAVIKSIKAIEKEANRQINRDANEFKRLTGETLYIEDEHDYVVIDQEDVHEGNSGAHIRNITIE